MKGRRALTLMEQWLVAQRTFSGVVRTRSGIQLPLRPTALSPTYHVRIDYAPERSPKVFVVSPRLRDLKKHRYKDGSLCLYYRGEYDNAMSLADTIIPWTAQWLHCYEIWQVQSDWPAPESPHSGVKTQEPLERRRDDR